MFQHSRYTLITKRVIPSRDGITMINPSWHLSEKMSLRLSKSAAVRCTKLCTTLNTLPVNEWSIDMITRIIILPILAISAHEQESLRNWCWFDVDEGRAGMISCELMATHTIDHLKREVLAVQNTFVIPATTIGSFDTRPWFWRLNIEIQDNGEALSIKYLETCLVVVKFSPCPLLSTSTVMKKTLQAMNFTCSTMYTSHSVIPSHLKCNSVTIWIQF